MVVCRASETDDVVATDIYITGGHPIIKLFFTDNYEKHPKQVVNYRHKVIGPGHYEISARHSV